MQTLRALPILNRPSRPSSPAPQTTNTTATAERPSLGLGIHHTASEPGKSRGPRPLHRQVADRVTSLHVNGHSHSQGPATTGAPSPAPPTPASNVPSPPQSRAATPRMPNGALPAGAPGETINAPSSGYMDVLGLRLNESVNKACAGVDFKAKKGFKKGSGWSVGEAVVKELPSPPSDAYLIRAILRTSVRAMSIYITRLESILLPALTDPAFVSPLNLHPPSASSHPLNPVQYFALSIAHAAWETCEVLEQTLEVGTWPKFVGETLRPVMDKFDLIVGKVIQPLLAALKRDLVAALARTEGTSPNGGKVIGLSSLPAPTTAPTAVKESGTGRLTKELSSGGTARQMPIPTSLQYFASRVDGARRILELVAAPCADDGEGWITGIAVPVIWKGMCVIAERDIMSGGNRPPSPTSLTKALNNIALKENGAAASVSAAHNVAGTMPPPAVPTQSGIAPSASLGHVTAKLTTILPARSASRAPSPPRQNSKWDTTTHHLISLQGLVKRLIGTMVPPALSATGAPGNVNGNAPPPSQTENIAREALHEAMEALESFKTVSVAMHPTAPAQVQARSQSQTRQPSVSPSARMLASCRRIRDDIDVADPVEEALDDAMEDTPAVHLYSLFIHQANKALSRTTYLQVPSDPEKAPVKSQQLPIIQAQTKDGASGVVDLRIRHPSEVWGWRYSEYERQVLGGFGPAEEWSKRVAMALKADIENVMSALALDIAVSNAASSTASIPVNGERGAGAGATEKVSSEVSSVVDEKSLGVRKEVIEAVEWVKCLGVLCDARGGVKIPSAS